MNGHTSSTRRRTIRIGRGVIALHKADHRWVFRFEPGCERDLIVLLAALAQRSASTGLDLHDAMLMTRRLAERLFQPTGHSAHDTSDGAADETVISIVVRRGPDINL